MTGIEMLAEVRQQSPETKLLLLTAYADTDVAIKAINDSPLIYYMFKPWDPPEEQLYPVVDGSPGRLSQAHPPETPQVRVLASVVRTHYEVKTFLTATTCLTGAGPGTSTMRPTPPRAGSATTMTCSVLVPDGDSLARTVDAATGGGARTAHAG
jgi:thioredoxin reductase (NADPH)